MRVVGRAALFAAVVAATVLASVAPIRASGRAPTESLRSATAVANGRITFVAGPGDGILHMKTIDPDGHGPKKRLRAWFAAWSPDGERFVFAAGDQDLWIVRADGTHRRHLTNGPGWVYSPSWSPDGGRVVFAGRTGQFAKRFQLYLIGSHGSGLRRITHSRSGAGQPAWSPDGRWIAYGGRGISLVRPNGTGTHSVTRRHVDFSPTWSPDGSRIAFTRTFHRGVRYLTDIWVVDADGTGLTRLTNDGKSSTPLWSPDGSLIAFERWKSQGNQDVYTMRPDGSDVTRVTGGPYVEFPTSWPAVHGAA